MTTIQKGLLFTVFILLPLIAFITAVMYQSSNGKKQSRDREKKHTDRVLEQLAILAEKESNVKITGIAGEIKDSEVKDGRTIINDFELHHITVEIVLANKERADE